MPELPEVERTRRSLEPALVGARVTSVRVRRADVVVLPGEPAGGWARSRMRPDPDRVVLPGLLLGDCTIRALERRGKQLAILTDQGPALCVHLGMSGQLVHDGVGTRRQAMDHVHVEWTLGNRGRMRFRDPRRFGGIWAYPQAADLIQDRWAGLGPDALELDGTTLRERAGASGRAIKTLLLDQRIVAGVGNIYADEALFKAGIHPASRGVEIDARAWSGLARVLRQTLLRAIDAGGSTIRDYRDGHGVPGRAQLAHAVYARAGLPCRRCGAPLVSGLFAQRTTVWCSTCQPLMQDR